MYGVLLKQLMRTSAGAALRETPAAPNRVATRHGQPILREQLRFLATAFTVYSSSRRQKKVHSSCRYPKYTDMDLSRPHAQHRHILHRHLRSHDRILRVSSC
jgi:hypothetical protein